MSSAPITLALGDQALDDLPRTSLSDNNLKAHLVCKLKLHSIVRHSASRMELVLPEILTQINCSNELADLLHNNVSRIGSRQKRSLSVSERVVESASTIWTYILMGLWHVLAVWIYPILTKGFIIGLICHRVVAEVVLQILDCRFSPDSVALKDVSATAQQVDVRLQQFCYWPIQYTTLRKRKDDWDSFTDSHPDYIRFYNSLWLVANDVIIGIALGSYIIDNADWVALQINEVLTDWTVKGLQRMIVWLADWPAGLKLNNELASFLGDLFLWVIEYWSSRLSTKSCVANRFTDQSKVVWTTSVPFCLMLSTSLASPASRELACQLLSSRIYCRCSQYIFIVSMLHQLAYTTGN